MVTEFTDRIVNIHLLILPESSFKNILELWKTREVEACVTDDGRNAGGRGKWESLSRNMEEVGGKPRFWSGS